MVGERSCRPNEIPIPITAIGSFFNRLDGLALRCAYYIYYLNYGIHSNKEAWISHEKLAKVVGGSREAVSRALAPPCRNKDDDGLLIEPLIHKSRPDDLSSYRYTIPAGSLAAKDAVHRSKDERSSLFSMRYFFVEQRSGVSMLNKNSGLSNAALKILPLIELLRCKEVDSWISVNNLLYSELTNKHIQVDDYVIQLPQIKRIKTLRAAIRELADIQNEYDEKQVIEINPQSNSLEFRVILGHKESLRYIENNEEVIINSEYILNGKDTNITTLRQKHHNIGAQTSQHKGANITTTEGQKHHDIRTETSQHKGANITSLEQKHHNVGLETSHILKEVVVVKLPTTGEAVAVNTYQLPDSLDFEIEFSNGDREAWNGRKLLALDVELKQANGIKPKSKEGSWTGYMGVMLNKMRKEGITTDVSGEGYNISPLVAHLEKKRQKKVVEPLRKKIRRIIGEGKIARLESSNTKLFVFSLDDDGARVKYGSCEKVQGSGELVLWREFYTILSETKWEISVVDYSKKEEKVESKRTFLEMDLAKVMQSKGSCVLWDKEGQESYQIKSYNGSSYMVVDPLGEEVKLSNMEMMVLLLDKKLVLAHEN